jgi:iron complex transport system ATP-binding protein
LILEVQDVRVKLGSTEILKDITFKLEEGELVALLGPNGSGKSTLLKTIFGVIRPFTGAIYLDGKQTAEMNTREIATLVGYLPQEGSDVGLRVIDIVLLGRTPYMDGFRKISGENLEIARKALKMVGLEGFEQRKFSELSGGEKQKVLLARVFTQETEVLLLDEPTSHLDISSQIEILSILKKKVEKGISALIAIHDINLAVSFCDRILLVKNGKIAYAGEPEAVITPYTIRDVFNAEVEVRKHGGKLYIIPKVIKPVKREKGISHIHVICGGGSGSNLIYLLSSQGYYISVGAVNTLDSDWNAAIEAGAEVIAEVPFSAISKEIHEANLKMIQRSDAVILTNLTIGVGNLPNLEAALIAAKEGKLFLINSTDFNERNFAGKKAEEIYEKIMKLLPETRIFRKKKDLLEVLNEILGS